MDIANGTDTYQFKVYMTGIGSGGITIVLMLGCGVS